MPNLSFEVISASPARDMISPALAFELRVANAFPEQKVHAVLLRCQIQIEPARRRYNAGEQLQLRELFDDPSRWGDTLRPITWVVTSAHVPAFSGSASYSLTVPCSCDFSLATAKYFFAMESGEVPLTFLFSGTVFFAPNGDEALQAAPISWDKEARFRLPIATWKSLMDLHYPNAAFLHLRRDVFEDLYRYKQSAGLATFDETIARILAIAEKEHRVS